MQRNGRTLEIVAEDLLEKKILHKQILTDIQELPSALSRRVHDRVFQESQPAAEHSTDSSFSGVIENLLSITIRVHYSFAFNAALL